MDAVLAQFWTRVGLVRPPAEQYGVVLARSERRADPQNRVVPKTSVKYHLKHLVPLEILRMMMLKALILAAIAVSAQAHDGEAHDSNSKCVSNIRWSPVGVVVVPRA